MLLRASEQLRVVLSPKIAQLNMLLVANRNCTRFCKINFRSCHQLREYFYNEGFQIYGIML